MPARLLLILALCSLCPLGFAFPARGQDFVQATQPRQWQFPRDHGRHDGYKTEWWYFTGNLADEAGRRFGYQLTFFRSQLAPPAGAATRPATRPSSWAVKDLYLAHAAISDLGNQKFEFRDRVQRGREGLAGASDRTLDVRLLDWQATLRDDGTIALVAKDGDFAIDLVCAVERGPILQGDCGLSPKGIKPGQASHYYSLTRLRTTGTITIGGVATNVAGLSWMDQEFSSNVLADHQTGWDWLSLQLDDGRDLMVFRLRNEQHATDFASATIIDPDGKTTPVDGSKVKMAGSEPWTSPKSGGTYPLRWDITVEGFGPVTVRAAMPGQELVTTGTTNVSYFEGAVEALDAAGKVIGRGYLEMTGYAKPMRGGF
jgi:predicted secreted hydrolase